MSKVTIKHVAREAKVSIGTVSRVLNGKQDVMPEYVERVRYAIAKLQYHPDPRASNLRRKERRAGFHTHRIGFLLTDMDPYLLASDEFQQQFLTGIESKIRASKLHLMIASGAEDVGKNQLPAMVGDQQVDGVVIKGSSQTQISWLEKLNAVLPVVLINNRVDSLPISSVISNNLGGGYHVMKYLHDLGHRKIGYLSIQDTHLLRSVDHEERFQSYQEMVRSLNLAAHPEYARQPARDWKTHSMEQTIDQALDAWIALGSDRPTAVFCANDLYAVCLIAQAKRKGLRIPEDLSVIGYGGLSMAQHSDPPLTSLAIPAYELGQAAIKLLCERIENPALSPRRILIDGRLVERLSCAHVS